MGTNIPRGNCRVKRVLISLIREFQILRSIEGDRKSRWYVYRETDIEIEGSKIRYRNHRVIFPLGRDDRIFADSSSERNRRDLKYYGRTKRFDTTANFVNFVSPFSKTDDKKRQSSIRTDNEIEGVIWRAINSNITFVVHRSMSEIRKFTVRAGVFTPRLVPSSSRHHQSRLSSNRQARRRLPLYLRNENQNPPFQ